MPGNQRSAAEELAHQFMARRLMQTTAQPEWLREKIERGDLVRNMIAHYERVTASMEDGFMPVIPQAIYAWSHEPQTINALQMAYRKHALSDESIGWDELGDLMATALSEAMGVTAFVRWLAEMTDDDSDRG